MNNFIKRITRDGLNCLENAVSAMKTRLDTFDFSQLDEEIEKIERKVDNIISSWKEETKKYVVRIPYDADTQIIKSRIDGNTFKVKVILDTNEDVREDVRVQEYTYRHESTIPNQFVNGTITQKYLKDKKTMLFIFQKPVVKEENIGNVEELIDAINDTLNENAETIVDGTALDPIAVEVEGEDTTAATITDEELEPPTEEDVNAKIWHLYMNGYSYRHIGREVGLSDKTVARRIKKMLA